PMRPPSRPLIVVLLVAAAATFAGINLAQGSNRAAPAPTTQIQHLVVIFDENVSFDHYFGTYPNAANTDGSTFTAAAGTPVPDGLNHDSLLTANPNAHNPARLTHSQAVTCDQDHGYADEQLAFNGGAMDKFVEHTAGGGCTDPGLVMDYYDGNTVTALWNLAQHFAMSDNFFGATFGPSTPGAINLISGNTHGVSPAVGENGTIIGDPNPAAEDCGGGTATMTGVNIGDRMNTAGVTWGWFQGGFKPTAVSGAGIATCGASHANAAGGTVTDYSAHHEPFQYYASTANPHHLPPSSDASIGQTDQANHQYDLTDFDTAVKNANLPQVSFLKPASFEDGHPGYSGPIDEQRFIARTLDALEQSSQWSSTAVIIAYDDSDGWYDHVYHAPTNSSAAASDGLNGPGQCGGAAPTAGGYQDRCGPGPRLPLLVVSPWAKQNAIDHTFTTQASIMKFIESNWGVGAIGDSSFDATAGPLDGLFDFAGATRAPAVYLDPATGLVVAPSTGPPPVTSPPVTKPPITKPPVVAKPKLSLTTTHSGKRLKVSLKLTGLSAAKGKITATVRLLRGKKTLATGTGTVKSGRLKLTLKAKKTLTKGTYRLATTVKQGKTTKRFTKTLKLK
ncbi:MAG: phospholipase, partial [Solirubrobacteraceae bacterium]|nr:phospholipase [Solirubrobacteraceae bacterium]